MNLSVRDTFQAMKQWEMNFEIETFGCRFEELYESRFKNACFSLSL